MASGTGGMHKSGKLAGRKEMRGTSLIELRRGRRREKKEHDKKMGRIGNNECV